MKVARVIGSVVASAHHPSFDGRKIMVVVPEGPSGEPLGDSFIAIDLVQAGPGDRVLVLTEGTGVRQLIGKDVGAVRSAIVGVVDQIDAPHISRD